MLMICPKAKECTNKEKGQSYMRDCKPHKQWAGCSCHTCGDFEGVACIPVEPTCPDCNGTGINPFKFPDARCPCTYKQAPQMPLIEMKYDNVLDPDGFYHDGAYARRDADMAWLPAHDLAVKKAFAEEIIKTMEIFESSESDPDLKTTIDCAWKVARLEYIAHIRAMAKEANNA